MNDLIAKLNNIFEGILGCEFIFQSLEEIEPTELWSKSDLAALSSPSEGRPRYFESIRHGAFGFPIDNEGQCVGLAVVSNYKEADPARLILLADLFSFVLESSLQSNAKREKLRLWEERLRLASDESNVIPLNKARIATAIVRHKNMGNVVDATRSSEEDSVVEFRERLSIEQGVEQGPLMTKPILIESSESFPLHRLVVELHQLSNRWALISAKDLPKDIFNSKESLKELGAITLFIPNLADLSVNEQLKLAEYLALPNEPESPQVIAGVNESIENLELGQKVLSHLLHLFYHSDLRWTEENESAVSTLEAKAEETKEVVQTSIRYMDDEIRRLHRVRDHLIPFHHQYFDPDHTTVH